MVLKHRKGSKLRVALIASAIFGVSGLKFSLVQRSCFPLDGAIREN